MTSLFKTPKMPTKSAEQIASEKHQASEIERLKTEESQRKAALTRSRGGRRSLISGAETGIQDTLG